PHTGGDMRLSYPIFRLQNYPQATGTRPRVLHRARWSLWAASPRWLRWLGARFAPAEEWGCGLADPIERRRGEPSAATGLYRAPGRAARALLGKAGGWRGRWWSLLGQVAWAGAMGGLPCLTGLCCGL